MKTTFKLLAAAQVLFFAALPIAATGQDAASQMKAETEHLQQLVAREPVTDPDWKDAKPDIEESLSAARDALRAGRLYTALEQLGNAQNMFLSTAATKENPEALKRGLPGFEAEWGKASIELTALDQKARDRTWTGTPAAVIALSQSAQGRTLTLLEASRAYASVTSPAEGFYYLGEAKASAEFASFCYGLKASSQGKPFPAHSILPELQRLQERTNAAYQPPLSVDRHRDFIHLNATLKTAGELDAAKLYAGALYQYLLAVGQLALLRADAPNAAQEARWRQSVVAMRSRLAASKQDDSIAQLFLERVEGQLAKESLGVDNWKRVGVIVEQVLPAYFAALQAPPPPEQPASNSIAVTLVRWPYT
ncbi:MAG: hypothetical protein LAO03_22090 [Acidobacteriia bacterium]|nr:hypothetical protein [Terriglobia bacterium]